MGSAPLTSSAPCPPTPPYFFLLSVPFPFPFLRCQEVTSADQPTSPVQRARHVIHIIQRGRLIRLTKLDTYVHGSTARQTQGLPEMSFRAKCASLSCAHDS